MFLNTPNLITLSRIILIPLIIGLYYLPDDWLTLHAKNVAATAVFILAAITDWLDGYLARRLNQLSAFGEFLDPVADKLIVVGALVVLLHLARVDALVALVIIGRELASSRPMIASATSASTRARCGGSTSAPGTISLSAPGARNSPKADI